MSEPDQTVISRLMAVIGGKTPIEDATHLLVPDVICHMGGYTVHGVDAWMRWVRYIRSRGVEDLEPEIDRMIPSPDGTITAVGRLRGKRRGRFVIAGEGSATYRVKDGRITEIWTSRENYELIFGRLVHHPWSWLLVLIHLAVWSRLPGQTSRLREVPAGSVASPSTSRSEPCEPSRSEPRYCSPADDHPGGQDPD